MSWTVPEPVSRSAVARGIRAQWQLQYRCPDEPGLLGILSAHDGWLVTVLHARTHAVGSPRALAVFEAFERELAKITGHDPVAWPKPFDLSPPPYGIGELEQLQPPQLLVATNGLAPSDDATRSLLALLLDRAFGGGTTSTRLRGEQRVALAGWSIPGPYADHWRNARGFEPSPRCETAVLAAGRELVTNAFGSGGATDDVHPSPREVGTELALSEAVDLICSSLVVRACLRASGDLPISSPGWATAPAANDGIGYQTDRRGDRRRVSA